jgi:hypothetical protein
MTRPPLTSALDTVSRKWRRRWMDLCGADLIFILARDSSLASGPSSNVSRPRRPPPVHQLPVRLMSSSFDRPSRQLITEKRPQGLDVRVARCVRRLVQGSERRHALDRWHNEPPRRAPAVRRAGGGGFAPVGETGTHLLFRSVDAAFQRRRPGPGKPLAIRGLGHVPADSAQPGSRTLNRRHQPGAHPTPTQGGLLPHYIRPVLETFVGHRWIPPVATGGDVLMNDPLLLASQNGIGIAGIKNHSTYRPLNSNTVSLLGQGIESRNEQRSRTHGREVIMRGHIRTFLVFVLAAAAFTLLPYPARPHTPTASAAAVDAVLTWNENAGEAATAACIAPLNDPFHESRMCAIMHIAIHDALNAIDRHSRPYAFDGPRQPGASPDAAVAAAARTVLVALISQLPSELTSAPCIAAGKASAESDYATALGLIPDRQAKTQGIALGEAAARAILARRATDGAVGPFLNFACPQDTDPGEYQCTPGTPFIAFEVWENVTPFVLNDSSQFRSEVE